MSNELELNVLTCDKENIRLDQYLSQEIEISRTRAVQMIEDELVLVNGESKNKKYLVKTGDIIEYQEMPDAMIDAKAQDIPLDIVYEDNDIIVVNKPQNMVVHPAPGNPDGTLVNALLFHCKDSLSGINGKLRPGIVHRIDKDTSGLIIVAKNDAAHIGLSEMFKDHSFQRKYQAILYGCPKEDEGTVNLAIGRSKKDRKKMTFYAPDSPNAKNAVTHYKVLERFNGYSHVELTLETGRTHQIRVHMLSLSCPVLADPLYATGRKNFGLEGQCLHAKFIRFRHPVTGKELTFDSHLPTYFEETLEKIRNC